MKILIDAQLSPHLAKWINQSFNVECYSITFLGLRESSDLEIYYYGRSENAVIVTKDEDFVNLHLRLGSPPKIIWITIGNTSNENMRKILLYKLPEVFTLLESHDMVEITD